VLFASGIVPSLKIGDADFKASTLTWEMVLVIGFVGVFWSGSSRISWRRKIRRATREMAPLWLVRIAEVTAVLTCSVAVGFLGGKVFPCPRFTLGRP
jgi:hypothetical protein